MLNRTLFDLGAVVGKRAQELSVSGAIQSARPQPSIGPQRTPGFRPTTLQVQSAIDSVRPQPRTPLRPAAPQVNSGPWTPKTPMPGATGFRGTP